MFAKMLNRYHHLGEKLVALYYTWWTGLSIHEDGKADLARVPVRAFGQAIPADFMQMVMCIGTCQCTCLMT